MSVKCGWASISEKNTVNGTKGDQTGKEVKTGAYYDFGQNLVIRFKDTTKAAKAAKALEAMCKNDNIGYGQNDRTTLFYECTKIGWDISKIGQIGLCNCDCSELVTCAINFAYGKALIAQTTYTGNLASRCINTGYFTTTSSFKESTLRAGDMPIRSGHHVIMALENGSAVTTTTSTSKIQVVDSSAKPKAAKYKDSSVVGTYTVTAEGTLMLRTDANTSAAIIAKLPKGTTVKCYGYYNKDSAGTKWPYVSVDGLVGYCSSKFLNKAK